jgi:GNAT superfamily N-acetyltransferase
VPIEISVYEPRYNAQVVELILKIQQDEFGVSITLEDQPDLLCIPSVYQRGNGNFWVALDGDNVVGTIAAIDIGNSQLALRKMFLEANYRGQSAGVAYQLLHTLLHWAKDKNVRKIYLGTTEKYKAAHRFYEKNGFVRVSKSGLPATFTVMQVDTIFYKLSLPTNGCEI